MGAAVSKCGDAFLVIGKGEGEVLGEREEDERLLEALNEGEGVKERIGEVGSNVEERNCMEEECGKTSF